MPRHEWRRGTQKVRLRKKVFREAWPWAMPCLLKLSSRRFFQLLRHFSDYFRV
jgi:hypothetical protein